MKMALFIWKNHITGFVLQQQIYADSSRCYSNLLSYNFKMKFLFVSCKTIAIILLKRL